MACSEQPEATSVNLLIHENSRKESYQLTANSHQLLKSI
jgi:hypothetical protein